MFLKKSNLTDTQDKDFQITIINMFKELKKDCYK